MKCNKCRVGLAHGHRQHSLLSTCTAKPLGGSTHSQQAEQFVSTICHNMHQSGTARPGLQHITRTESCRSWWAQHFQNKLCTSHRLSCPAMFVSGHLHCAPATSANFVLGCYQACLQLPVAHNSSLVELQSTAQQHILI
jgi:hypothetical protein